MYTIKFANETLEHYSEEQLLNFVKTAVIRNKDISSFSVIREDSPTVLRTYKK